MTRFTWKLNSPTERQDLARRLAKVRGHRHTATDNESAMPESRLPLSETNEDHQENLGVRPTRNIKRPA